jgi:hypothetical protein
LGKDGERREAMEREILVLFRRRDRIEEILPHIEKIAQPGMRVVFLVPYPVKLWPWVRDHWVTTDSSREAMVAGREIMDKYSWEAQKELADQKIFLARAVLHKKQVDVVVNLCVSSMRRVIKDHSVDRKARWVLFRAENRYQLINLIRRTLSLFGASKRPVSPPVLVLHPGR